ncbi:MAG: hypothetical protein JWN44_6144 [Myxococcales bacterium]|nr:hypothetical protein [Myxococcales bacterium]
MDVAQLERTLDLWASMWEPRERAQFERALERVLETPAPASLKLAALAACQVIASPRLLGAAGRASPAFDAGSLAEVAQVAVPLARLCHHAERLRRDTSGVYFLLEKSVRDPANPVADKLLDRVDVRDLYAVMQASDGEALRIEAARRIARRGPHQRARLMTSLHVDPDAFADSFSVDVPLDDLEPPPSFDVPLDELSA